jgi:YHS domain-containing protein
MNRITLILVSMLVSSGVLMAQDATSLRKANYNLENGVAIQGYDPVAYFTQHKAIKGNKNLAVFVDGVTYYFASEADRNAFKQNPGKYEPEYGGWCAYAMGAKGEKVSIDPETFKLIDNKLFLFYNRFFNNTLKDWNKDESNLKAQADKNWQKFNH